MAKSVKKLYVLPITDETLEYIDNQEYKLLKPRYALVLTGKKPSVPHATFEGNELEYLRPDEADWLAKCIVRIAAKIAEENKDDLLKEQYKFLKEFEKELEAEKQRREESDGNEEAKGGDN